MFGKMKKVLLGYMKKIIVIVVVLEKHKVLQQEDFLIKYLLEKYEEIQPDYYLRRYLEKGINEGKLNKNYLYRMKSQRDRDINQF